MAKPAPPQFLVQVAVPSPLHRYFDYLPLPEQPLPSPGMRVQIGFGKQKLTGIVVGITTETDTPREKLRCLDAILDSEPLIENHLLALYRWSSQYYLFPPGMALQTSLPRALREGKALPSAVLLVWQLIFPLVEPQGRKLTARQQQALDALKHFLQLNTTELSALLGTSARPVMQSLLARGLVEQISVTVSNEVIARVAQTPLVLNEEQNSALASLRAAKGFACFLLEGITGSGKTEVYLQLIADKLHQGLQVLVLVPEISLTPQTVSRFSDRFHARIVAFHSGLTDKQRLAGWLQARNGAAHIVIGTRSAIFTPLAKPGLIVIDEEHDDSYKQQDGFRYSARDVAVFRARQLGIPVLLGSATPSLESLHNALSGRYHLLTLSQRAGNAAIPKLRTLDLRLQSCTDGVSPLLLQRIKETLHAREQVLVFLNRRGFAPLLLCIDCGWIAECPRCEHSYTLHQHPACLRCHHCDSTKPLPRNCGHCQGNNLETKGLGTERSADFLAAQFPDFPVLRIDRDSTRASGSLDSLMQQVHSGIPCILVGTQMLAKGHHFPRVTLVAVLDADSGLFSADFRAQENLAQLLTQVSGRAGRSDRPGEVMIQTWHPQHPSLVNLVNAGYGIFARQLLAERQGGGLPPFSYFLLIRAEGSQRQLPLDFLQGLLAALKSETPRDLKLLGPMPSPFGKKAGVFRAQLVVQAARRTALQRFGPRLLQLLEANPLTRKVRWSIDVDPTDFN